MRFSDEFKEDPFTTLTKLCFLELLNKSEIKIGEQEKKEIAELINESEELKREKAKLLALFQKAIDKKESDPEARLLYVKYLEKDIKFSKKCEMFCKKHKKDFPKMEKVIKKCQGKIKSLNEELIKFSKLL